MTASSSGESDWIVDRMLFLCFRVSPSSPFDLKRMISIKRNLVYINLTFIPGSHFFRVIFFIVIMLHIIEGCSR